MNHNSRDYEIRIRVLTNRFLRIALAALILTIAGCAAPGAPKAPAPMPTATSAHYTSADVRVRLVGVLRAGDEGTLVLDPGWREYILAVENTGTRPLTIHNVKLLTRAGRYFDSASTYEQIIVPPDTATEIAGTVATRAAGVAAGQVIPYGGSLVSIITSAVSASAAEKAAIAGRELNQRKLKEVELAPNGKVIGSAYLPYVSNARALVVDYGHGDDVERIEIPLTPTGT